MGSPPARATPEKDGMLLHGRGFLTGHNARLLALLACTLAGCAAPGGHEAASGAGAAADAVAAPEGTYLAYEHDVRVQLPGADITPRLQALAQACQQARFGDCAVLQMGQEGGQYPSASIRMRLAPAAVEPVVALAGEKGRVAARSTQAEDLAQQVNDTRLAQQRLKNEHATLMGYQQRRDLAVADLLSISQRLAELEAQMQQAEQQAAQQRRRIDTQLLTVQLQTPAGEDRRSEIGDALRESGAVFAASVAFVIRAVAALVPVLVVGGLAGWIGLRLWRRRRRQRS